MIDVAVASIDATANAKVPPWRRKTVLEKSIIVGVGALMFFQVTKNVFGAIQFDPRAE
jgi:hypothetical protein